MGNDVSPENEVLQSNTATTEPNEELQAPDDMTVEIMDETKTELSQQELLENLALAQRKADEHWNDLLRVRAEIDNMRKRAARELENAHKYALERYITELLPVQDSLELGLQAAEKTTDLSTIRQGVELTLKMLNTVLEKSGVTMLNPVGEKFNPEHHQAVSIQEGNGAEPGTVMSVMQKGFLLNERVIRPAMVVVAKT